MNRRGFIKLASLAAVCRPAWLQAAAAPEILYNGIQLPPQWPPRYELTALPATPPYVSNPPRVINIDVGRQLFVDDFLIETTTLTRWFHATTYHEANPILRPDRSWEQAGSSPTSMVFSDGVIWDPKDGVFKMWYMGGYTRTTCLATSADGIHWTKPRLDVVPGTNIVLNEPRDSTTVWLDTEESDPERRYKMSLFPLGRASNPLTLYVSGDGVHWRAVGQTGIAGDRSTVFWNPFRRVWAYSIRAGGEVGEAGRHRRYFESQTFEARWSASDAVAWARADRLDVRRDDTGAIPQLYSLDCVAYESVLLGLFSIWRGEFPNRPKHNDVCVGFSRDGFHWDRSYRQPILPLSEREGDWNWANTQSAGGCCLVVGSKLFFYVSGRRGQQDGSEPGICSTGLATMRRDGFASMTPRALPEGTLTTRPVRFSGRYVFVNAETMGGDLRVEVLDEHGQVLEPYTRSACVPLRGDDTCHRVTWANDGDIATLAGRPIRFRFFLTRGHLYAFWVSASVNGASRGYVGAGGPGFSGAIDTAGRRA